MHHERDVESTGRDHGATVQGLEWGVAGLNFGRAQLRGRFVCLPELRFCFNFENSFSSLEQYLLAG
jgi:hypothetical protein